MIVFLLNMYVKFVYVLLIGILEKILTRRRIDMAHLVVYTSKEVNFINHGEVFDWSSFQ